jgi:WD40 repeat protein
MRLAEVRFWVVGIVTVFTLAAPMEALAYDACSNTYYRRMVEDVCQICETNNIWYVETNQEFCLGQVRLHPEFTVSSPQSTKSFAQNLVASRLSMSEIASNHADSIESINPWVSDGYRTYQTDRYVVDASGKLLDRITGRYPQTSAGLYFNRYYQPDSTLAQIADSGGSPSVIVSGGNEHAGAQGSRPTDNSVRPRTLVQPNFRGKPTVSKSESPETPKLADTSVNFDSKGNDQGDLKPIIAAKQVVPNPIVEFSRDGSKVYVAFPDRLEAWDLKNGQKLWTFNVPSGGTCHLTSGQGYISSLRLSQNGKIIALAGLGFTGIIDVSNGSLVKQNNLEPCSYSEPSLDFSADGNHVLLSNIPSPMKFEISTGKTTPAVVPEWTLSDSKPTFARFYGPWASDLITGDESGHITIWTYYNYGYKNEGWFKRPLGGHTTRIVGLERIGQADSAMFLTASADGNMRLMNTNDERYPKWVAKVPDNCQVVQVSPNQKIAATLSFGRPNDLGFNSIILRLWDMENGKQLTERILTHSEVPHDFGLTFSPDNRYLYFSGRDGQQNKPSVYDLSTLIDASYISHPTFDPESLKKVWQAVF